MTPRDRTMAAIDEIALRHDVSRAAILGRTDTKKTRKARREAVAYLESEGKNCVEIGIIMSRHWTTILYLLGRVKHDRNVKPAKTANDNSDRADSGDNARTG